MAVCPPAEHIKKRAACRNVVTLHDVAWFAMLKAIAGQCKQANRRTEKWKGVGTQETDRRTSS